MFQQQTFLNNPGERGNTDCVACPSSDKNRYKIFIDVFCWAHLQNIMYNLGHTEYSAYLLGTRSEDGCEFKIDGFYIPQQQVTSVESKITEDLLQIPREIRQIICGHIHSHHVMSTSSSGTDLGHMNYPLHIIIGFQGRYSATVRVKTECGKFMRITDIPITFMGTPIGIGHGMEKIEKIEREYSRSRGEEEKEDMLEACFYCGETFDSSKVSIEYDGEKYCSDECLKEYKAALNVNEAFQRAMSSEDNDDSSEQKQPLIAGNWEIKTGAVF